LNHFYYLEEHGPEASPDSRNGFLWSGRPWSGSDFESQALWPAMVGTVENKLKQECFFCFCEETYQFHFGDSKISVIKVGGVPYCSM
jgi:hypothetical protein